MNNIVYNIVATTRRSGNTTWLLKAAIKNPKCIIVCKDLNYANYLEKRYASMLYKSPWYMKLWWKIVGRATPFFFSLKTNFDGRNRPVIFDNSALMDM